MAVRNNGADVSDFPKRNSKTVAQNAFCLMTLTCKKIHKKTSKKERGHAIVTSRNNQMTAMHKHSPPRVMVVLFFFFDIKCFALLTTNNRTAAMVGEPLLLSRSRSSVLFLLTEERSWDRRQKCRPRRMKRERTFRSRVQTHRNQYS